MVVVSEPVVIVLVALVPVLENVVAVVVTDVFVVVSVRVHEVCVTLSEVTDVEDVFVAVVQMPQVASHRPPKPHVGQNRAAQASSQRLPALWQVALQNQSGLRFNCVQRVPDVSEVAVVIVAELAVEVCEEVADVVDSVRVLRVVDSVDAVVDDEDKVVVAVVFSAQTSQVVSHMWAAGHVGQKTVLQVQLA